MKTIVYIILAIAMFGNAPTRCLSQNDGRLPTKIEVAPSGLPPEAAAEISRVAGEYLKADKPANDAMVRAIALRDAGNLAGAVEESRKALALAVKPAGHTYHPEAYQLLGELALRQNRVDDAFREFKLWAAELDYRKSVLSLSPFGKKSDDACIALNVALAYCQRGNLQLALKAFRNPDIPKLPPGYLNMFKAEDGPGTQTLAGLQATILLQIAYNQQSDTRSEKESDRCLLAAAQLAPKNVMVAYACAKMLGDRKKFPEALPYWKLIAANGKERVAQEATRKIDYITNTLTRPYVEEKAAKEP